MLCEIEFLAVGDGSKAGDAIIVRYGEEHDFDLLVVDGGDLTSGRRLVDHIKRNYGVSFPVAHMLVTHADRDHASGARTVLAELNVQRFWANLPWQFSAGARHWFAHEGWTNETLAQAIYNEYDILVDLVGEASRRGIPISLPLAGTAIGPFQVLSPLAEWYEAMLPQFDRTPAADESALKGAGLWLGKSQPGVIGALLEKAAAKIQRWIPESWTSERLKDGGVTSASNETSVVLYGDMGADRRVLLTADAGLCALTLAAEEAITRGLPLQKFSFVQIPHHGSRNNVGPSILDRLLGPIQVQGTPSRFSAFVSAPKDDGMHPRKIVLNAFTRRGARVVATQGFNKVHWGGFNPRRGYSTAELQPLWPDVEEYD